MKNNFLYFISFIIIISCKVDKDRYNLSVFNKLKLVIDFETDTLFYEKIGLIKEGIHRKSIYFNGKNNKVIIKNKLKSLDSFSFAIWIKPEFSHRNGTIINFSKNEKNFPIDSSISLFLNKNKIAIMQKGMDLRKIGYINKNNFSQYFESLPTLLPNQNYFLVYTYANKILRLYLDGKLYSEYSAIVKPSEFNYITLGVSYNKKGQKYFYKGYMDDIYIYNKELNLKEIINLMDYTHLFQYEK